MNVYSRDVPVAQNVQESEIYHSNPWWKAQKWCIQICHKLIAIRARNDDTGSTEQFLREFLAKYAVPIQEAILVRLGKLQGGKGYIPPRIVAYSFLYLTEAFAFSFSLHFCYPQCSHLLRILPSVTYKALVPHIEQFLETVLFPVMFFTSEDQEIWDSDPQEFIRREHGTVLPQIDKNSSSNTDAQILYTMISHPRKLLWNSCMSSLRSDQRRTCLRLFNSLSQNCNSINNQTLRTSKTNTQR